jgi:hypothetical protein
MFLNTRRRSDAGIMTDEWIQNSQKDEAPPTKITL